MADLSRYGPLTPIKVTARTVEGTYAMTTPEISTPEQLDEYRARSIDARAFRWPSHSVNDTYQLQERRFCLIKKMVSLRHADEALGIPTEVLLALIRGEAVVVPKELTQAMTPEAVVVPKYVNEDNAEAIRYMTRLFKHLAPQCTPLDTAVGLATQLDNYIAGLLQWQPIETAPIDDGNIYLLTDGKQVLTGSISRNDWGDIYCPTSDLESIAATHWAHLPASPYAKQGEK